MKRCFVISPIGAEGSAVREHADDVYDYIIRPAMEACGIEAFRSDHMREPGKISDQMFGAILNYDLCVAVLTGHNPNVFYEMAIAQCAARPLIILIEKGQEIPFDIRDLRCVSYDLKPRPLFQRTYLDEIVAHVRSLEAAGWKVAVPFGALTPLGGGAADRDQPFRFLERSVDFGGLDAWMDHLKGTERIFEVVGITCTSWRRTNGFGAILAQKAATGCAARILLMHPDNPALAQYFNRAIPESTYDHAVHDIKVMHAYFRDIARGQPNVEVRQIRRGCPHFQLTRTDRIAIVSQYFYAQRPNYCPLWHCTPGSSLYTLTSLEFESLWKANAPEGEPPEPVAAGRHDPAAASSRSPASRARRGGNGRT